MADASASLDLPPPYKLVALREAGDAHGHACQVAAEDGAGTFVWVRRYDVLEVAVVLEPEEPLASARRAFFVGMTALADAVTSHCPPEKSLSFEWPDTIRLDSARIGGGRLGWPAPCGEADVPAWLVFSAMLIAAKARTGETGLTPFSTSFEDEGFDPTARENVAESFARHLLLSFDQYHNEGFAPIAASYLRRLENPGGDLHPGISNDGNLVVRNANRNGRQRHRQIPLSLDTPGWLDPETGTVRL